MKMFPVNFSVVVRRIIVTLVHLGFVVVANASAFWLRFDGRIPDVEWNLWIVMVPWLIAIRGLTFIPFGLYFGVWRFAGLWDLKNILGAVLSSSFVFYIVVHWVYGFKAYPRSTFIIDALLLVVFLGGLRFARRMARELLPSTKGKRILIYGAGAAGELILRDMKHNAFYDYRPIGLVDDDPRKIGEIIHGVKVLGTRHDLPRIISVYEPEEVLVAISNAKPTVIRDIVRDLESFKIPIKTVPNLRDILEGKITVNQIRNLSVEDLLDRAPVGLDPAPLKKLVLGRTILVTGAGGSIGSEICRQIVKLNPRQLILLERYENSLYEIEYELKTSNPHADIRPVLLDVTNRAGLSHVMKAHRPDAVFHAAAHKHVPLSELNVCEVVKNNVMGIQAILEIAETNGVKRFVQISTDKAVNPSSIMGVTKRIAELIMLARAKTYQMDLVTVRFGNVLGSHGSVVPRFLDQIKAGGPVTVTHPDMKRFFMLIPEAVQLVLHAAASGKKGEIYVLEMGDQINVAEMARQLIRLAGYIPDDEIHIKFIGPRPGEKLFEELVGDDESLEASGIEKISRLAGKAEIDPEMLDDQLSRLENLVGSGDDKAVAGYLKELVPNYKPVVLS